MLRTVLQMQYAIVEFVEAKEVEVVPCSWIRGNKCLWPNRPSNKVVRMVKKGSPPGMDCAEYNAQVKGIFVSYRDARLKLPISELTSDMNSDVPAKRRRVSKVIESEDDFPPVPGSFILAAKEATTRQGEHLPATTHPWKDTAARSETVHPSVRRIDERSMPLRAQSETMHTLATSMEERPLPRRSRSETVHPSVRRIDERSMPLRAHSLAAQSETMHRLATSMEERPLPRRSRSETVQPVVPTIEERPMPLHGRQSLVVTCRFKLKRGLQLQG
ncbi:uncharacterized protein LOC135373623 isoform X3 [Ornithodoros turicata]|uniref:uncharacterized protein LOC135373623 isoform X3 n=1 Tax=Ornithodoros turicata TaxID=34597 RepID=UPI00313A3CCA